MAVPTTDLEQIGRARRGKCRETSQDGVDLHVTSGLIEHRGRRIQLVLLSLLAVVLKDQLIVAPGSGSLTGSAPPIRQNDRSSQTFALSKWSLLMGVGRRSLIQSLSQARPSSGQPLLRLRPTWEHIRVPPFTPVRLHLGPWEGAESYQCLLGSRSELRRRRVIPPPAPLG